MSSLAPESSNPKSEDVTVEIPDNNQLVRHNNTSMIKEWEGCLRGKEITNSYNRQRHIQKVPPLLLESEKGQRNRKCYEPAVVSLGPYHHNQTHLAQAEKYKLITLEEYRLITAKPIDAIYREVFEVVHDARKCYIDGSTDAYSDHEFNQMMLRDGCFILFFIECISNKKLLLNNEYFGAIGFAKIMSDIFLLENQIPFIVLEVLLKLKFPDDKGEDILITFFNYLNFGKMTKRDDRVLENKNPLHLLELYRSYFISLSPSLGKMKSRSDEDYNSIKLNRGFASATELKSKWVFLDVSRSTNEDVKWEVHSFHGEFKLARRAVSWYTKSIYLNMIAYEMCPHNPNDFRVSSYIKIMKALIIRAEDVKELRDKHILKHGLRRDMEVVEMFDEIEVPPVNLNMYNQLRYEIKKLHTSNFKTWVAELVTEYFGSPWKAMGMLVATAILLTSFLQTYLAMKPRDR